MGPQYLIRSPLSSAIPVRLSLSLSLSLACPPSPAAGVLVGRVVLAGFLAGRRCVSSPDQPVSQPKSKTERLEQHGSDVPPFGNAAASAGASSLGLSKTAPIPPWCGLVYRWLPAEHTFLLAWRLTRPLLRRREVVQLKPRTKFAKHSFSSVV